MNDELEEIWVAHEVQIESEEVERARAAAASDQVICQECARAFGQITEQHLQKHDMTLGDYEMAHPDAPIYPDDSGRQPGREPGFTHSEETKRKIGESAKQNHDRGAYQ